MASRKEQKEKARQQRLAQERARAAAARRAKRLRLASGTVIAVAAIVAVGIAIALGHSGKHPGTGQPITPVKSAFTLPAQKITSLTAAAKAAHCVTIDTPDSIARTSQNRLHVAVGTNVKYGTNPPSYGPHYPVPAHDGEYAPANTPPIEYFVHALEHGRIEYEYRPGLPSQDVKELEALTQEPEGSFAGGQLMVMFQNQTGMPYDVAAVAWGHVLGCKRFDPGVIDAFRAFRLAYTDKGPEQLGLGPE